MRRGRQAKVRSGQLLPWTRAPYGYRLHPEHPRDVSLIAIDPVQAAIIHELFQDYGAGGVSLYHLACRLTRRHVPSPGGKAHWSANSIRLILRNPCYTGTAYSQRTCRRTPARRKSPLQPVGRGESWELTPAEEWIGVTIPALVSQEVFDRVQARLATNQQMAQRSTRHAYLLRGLVSCGHCHLQCHGRFRAPGYYYYLCRGKAPSESSCRDARCRARHIPAEQLDRLVWDDLCVVLQHPELISLALERAHSGAWLPEELQQRQTNIQQALRSLERERERLLAAYLAEAIELAEFEHRQRELVRQRDDLEGQASQVAHYSEQLLQVREAIPTVQAICERLQMGLAEATFAQRRQLLELLVDCVVVTDDQVEIRYVIPTTEASTHVRFCHLRKDYFDPGS
jgi:site-specific DNA recombinase